MLESSALKADFRVPSLLLLLLFMLLLLSLLFVAAAESVAPASASAVGAKAAVAVTQFIAAINAASLCYCCSSSYSTAVCSPQSPRLLAPSYTISDSGSSSHLLDCCGVSRHHSCNGLLHASCTGHHPQKLNKYTPSLVRMSLIWRYVF
eukprot:TRINITY_DN13846_c0_g1_i1.p1 TRINITY_DN13846_c0_g1~~TRINITY_DN13846_c0_g1_i1.p1  ORF type:complete len:149 (-),score=10.71 TRINITY_DN13846_c0_g1_i1:749-1195(-)